MVSGPPSIPPFSQSRRFIKSHSVVPYFRPGCCAAGRRSTAGFGYKLFLSY